MAMSEYPFHVLKVPGGITATQFGLALDPILDGADLTSKDDISTGPWLEHKTAIPPDLPTSGGILTTLNAVKGLWRPIVELLIRTPSTIGDMRIWAGFFSVKPDAIATPTPNQHFAAFRYDTTAAIEPNKWHRVNSNGLTVDDQPISPMGTFVQPNTQYSLKVALGAAGVSFLLDGVTPGSSTVSVPDPLVFLGFGVRVTTLAAAARAVEWSRVSWTYQIP